MKTHQPRCHLMPLAVSDLGNITVCEDCNVITLTVQSVSIRFEPPTFDQLARMTSQARSALLRVLREMAAANPNALEGSRLMPEHDSRH